MADKVTEALVDALKQALAESGDQRLYRSGKLSGLFPGRGSVNGEAATRAIKDGLLEVVRTEARGKTECEWVRITPRGVEFLHESQSPLRVLEELRDTLHMTREGVPVWVAELQQGLRAIGSKLADDVQRLNQRLEALHLRVEEALRRVDLHNVQATNGDGAIAWARDALAYLDVRRNAGKLDNCTLPELFAALRPQHSGLSIPAFLDGLRRLYDRRALQLLPFQGALQDVPEPEYAFLDGATLMYYVAR